MTIHLSSSVLLFLVDKFGRGESLIASAIMPTSICLMVGWEQKIFGNVYSLFFFVSCMFGHLTGFLFFLIRILVISWSYPFSTTTISNSLPSVIGHCYKVTLDVIWIRKPLDPVLCGWKEIQGELHPITTTLKFALESLMEIKLHRCLTNKCSTKKCLCTRVDFS